MYTKVLNFVGNSYFFIALFSIIIGLLFDSILIHAASWSTVVLGAIFFLSALKIDMKLVARYATRPYLIGLVVLYMLIVFPVVVYFGTSFLAPGLALPFLILAAMPSGMTDPLLAEIAGGKQSLALVLTIATSLLAPFTVPFMIKMLAGTAISVSFFEMFLSLAKVIFIPFVLAQVLKFFIPAYWLERSVKSFKPISILLLGLLIASLVAKQADAILEGLRSAMVWQYLIYLFILFVIFHVVSFFCAPVRGLRDRITVTVTLVYMNFTLAIYIADTFFVDEAVVVPTILAIIPWALLLTPFRKIAHVFSHAAH